MTVEGATPRRRRRGWRSRLVRAVLFVLGLLAVVVLAGLGYELSIPSVANAPARVAAIVRVHRGEAGNLPLLIKLGEAMVAVEDEHFYSNVVLNVFDGAARAALATLHTSGDPGGSTIAQQLAKQLYPSGTGFGATLEQVGLGLKLSLSYSKPQILEMYLNAIYYGNGYWGYVTAARGYFGVSPNQLTWAEAAMLAGLPQAPSGYDPVLHLALAKQRQRQVLDQLVANHILTAAQSDAAYQAPLHLRR
jgi:membrane peptidoglycan carboxypeptidase